MQVLLNIHSNETKTRTTLGKQGCMFISPTDDIEAVRLGETPKVTSVDGEEKHSDILKSENAEKPAKTLQDPWGGELGDCCLHPNEERFS